MTDNPVRLAQDLLKAASAVVSNAQWEHIGKDPKTHEEISQACVAQGDMYALSDAVEEFEKVAERPSLMGNAGSILAKAREDMEDANAGHCGCCKNLKAERIVKQALVDLLNVAVHALQCVRDLDDQELGQWSWGGDECPLENARAMRDDMRAEVDGGAR